MVDLVKKYRVLVIGIVALSTGVPAYAIGLDLIALQSACPYPNGKWPPGNDYFPPNTILTASCQASRSSGQDLTLWAEFHDQQSGEPIPIPARVEIRDPNNVVLVDEEFNQGRIILYVTPQLSGNYTATITSLEDRRNRVTTGEPYVFYALGYLTSNGFEGVNNPVGTSVQIMLVVGNAAALAGGILIAYALIQIFRKKRETVGSAHSSSVS
jgi:hypothetical protein